MLGILLGCFTLVFAFHLFSFSELSHRLFAKRVQHAMLKVDDRLQQSKRAVLDAFIAWNQFGDFPVEDIALSKGVDLLVYYGDTLVYWSDNRVEPKLLRKRMGVASDTLIELNCADYLACSLLLSGYHFYLYSLINTHYPLENEFFVNRFFPIFGRHHLSFSNLDAPDAYPLYSHDGTLLAYYSLSFPALGTSANMSLLVFCLLLMLLCAYLLVLRNLIDKQQSCFEKQSSHSEEKQKPHKGAKAWFVIACLLFYLLFALLFLFLFRYCFSTGFFIPTTMRLDNCLVLVFIGVLGMVTGVLFLMRRYQKVFHDRGTVLVTILHFLLLGLLLTMIYDIEYQKFENQQVKELALSLSDERDPGFESAFDQFVEAAQHDTVFHQMMLSEDVMDVVVKDYLRSFLFDSVMNKYNVSVTLCNPGMELVLQPYNTVQNCDQYFLSKVSDNHGFQVSNGLYFVDYNTLDPNYLGAISISLSDTLDLSTLYLEFSKPIVPQSFGLPSMLKDEHSLLPWDYSVACYRDSLLVYKFGSYIFPTYLSDYHHALNEFSVGRKLRHYVHQSDDAKVVALCLDRRGFMELTSPFVVFFLPMLIVFLLVYVVGFGTKGHPLTNTLSRKFQMMVLVTLSVSLLLAGVVSVYFINRLNNQKTNDFHFERTRSLLLDITEEVDFSFLRMPGFRSMLDEILRHYSETFFTDINVYDLDGRMLSTTAPEMIDLRLQSSLMDPEAFHNMRGERMLYYIHDERLGKAVYQSAYIAIQDEAGNTMAYLNTPYFTSNSALRSEILNYTLTYINAIVLVILLSLLVVWYLSRRITSPLTELQEKMQLMSLNKRNELIEWHSNDEIGALIEQFNLLVLDLEKKVAELKRTTTESAWRSVARQVAHEIKNSLTPMRLSVQMLQRHIENGDDNLDEHARRTAATLIEQIDALSDIASSFSSYAKLPEHHPQPFDLAELVANLVHLYSNEENITLHYECDPDTDFTFVGDKTNLNSAIGNILKNAVQAIGAKDDGHIDVALREVADKFILSIKDNGKGIKEEYKSQIFMPNFTTKSGGSGVGLSLAYNIIQMAGGTITFESEEGKGTEFVVEVESGKWKVESGKWKVENARRAKDNKFA